MCHQPRFGDMTRRVHAQPLVHAAETLCWWNGRMSCRISTSSLSTTHFTGRKPTNRKYERWYTFMAAERVRKVMATRKTGLSLGSPQRATIRIDRKLRHFSIMIMQWVLLG